MNFLNKRIILSFCIVLLTKEILPGQNLSTLVNYLGDDVAKSVNKAEQKISEAGHLIQEANEYYNEALALQSNYELDEKTYQKQLKSAEDKAISTQIKADKLYAEAYKSLYQLCEKGLSEHTIVPGDPAEEYINKASGFMDDAASKRKEVTKTASVYEKASMLNDASGMENAAIENMIIAIQLVNGLTPVETSDENIGEEEALQIEQPAIDEITSPSTTPEVSAQMSNDITIDQGSVNTYNEYVADVSEPDPITLTAAGVSGADDMSFEDAKDNLHQYQYGDRMLVNESSAVKLDELELAQQEIPEGEKEIVETTTYEQISQAEEESTAYAAVTSETTETSETSTPIVSETPAVIPVNEVRFMVQIAASRVPLTKSQVSAIYPGDLTVEVMRENEWLKYRITGYRLFSDANKAVHESGVRGAWVISTYSGQIIGLPEARDKTRAIESDIKKFGRSALKNDIDFYIQLAASRVRLNNEIVTGICGEHQCREIIEEGWFKYQVYAGTNYSDALSLQKSISRESFIVAYKSGIKLKLFKAIR